uniref:Thaumatin-like protein n=1 Tax=Ananas comosus var. bracteatus TaxID=296719 RepID=A0A6V7NGC5_ANACO|nr:unnamed protein product [Ananas comosus var. bracteatus]
MRFVEIAHRWNSTHTSKQLRQQRVAGDHGQRRPADAAVWWIPVGGCRGSGVRRAGRVVGAHMGRQGCCFDEHGKGTCETGDCGNGLRCGGAGGKPPATVVEMTFGTARSPLHYYDVSLVDGFNLPVAMSPVGGGIGCGVAGCEVGEFETASVAVSSYH